MTGQSSDNVASLAARFQNGDERAFAILIDVMMPMLRREVSRIRCNRADADDLAQEALLGLLTAAKRFSAEAGTDFTAFARVCVRNRLLNAVQKLTTPETPQESDVVLSEIERSADLTLGDPGEQLMLREEDAAFLHRIKEHLSMLEYAVLMRYLFAYSYEEIAVALNISVKSVDNALQRVRKKLSHVL